MNENMDQTSRNHSGNSTPDDSIRVALNGIERTAPVGSSVETFLCEQGVDPERTGIAVALNDRLVRRSDWTEQILGEGDRLEVITALQGG